jgi:hypothetical protein
MHIMKNHGRRGAKDCLAKNGSEVRAKIKQGYAAAQCGRLIDSDQVRSAVEERKRAWIAEQHQAGAVESSL